MGKRLPKNSRTSHAVMQKRKGSINQCTGVTYLVTPLNLSTGLNIDFEKGGGIQSIEEARDTDKNNYSVCPASEIFVLYPKESYNSDSETFSQVYIN